VRGGRQQPRERVLPEPDLDHHGPGLALLRVPGRSAREGGAVKIDRREMLKLATSVAVARSLARGEAFAAAAAASAPRFFTPRELALLDAIAEAIVPADAP